MTDAEGGAGFGERDQRRCAGCDPDLLDELKCQASGIQAQAVYNAAHEQDLTDARDAFKKARAGYNAARSKAVPLVADARRQLEDLTDRVRCQLDRHDAECIDTAFGRVSERLDRCGHGRGCCSDGDCDYDDIRDCDPDDVPGRKAVIEYRTKEAQECFWCLIGEYTVVPKKPAPSDPAPADAAPADAAPAAGAPAGAAPAVAAVATAPAASPTPATTPAPATAAASAATAAPAADGAAPVAPGDGTDAALPTRVTDLQSEIDKISSAAADGSWDPPQLYAAVLVARRHLKDVWRGFANVNEYMECLCRALTCMIKGYAAISELTRQAAVNQCYRDSWKTTCDYLAGNTVEEVLAEYLRICESTDEDRPDRGEREPHFRDRDRRDRDGHGRDDDHGRPHDRRPAEDRGHRDADDGRGDDWGGDGERDRVRDREVERGEDRAESRPQRPRDDRGRYYRAP